MPRRPVRRNRATELKPDERFDSLKVQKLTKMVMKDGKYNKAYNIVCRALDEAYDRRQGSAAEKGQGRDDAILAMLDDIIEQGPQVQIKTRRVGGANYPVPETLTASRKLVLLFRWMIGSARKRSEKTMILNLCHEMLDLLAGRGGTAQKIKEVHSMAKANVAFANVGRR